MKMNIKELRALISTELREAKRKKKDADEIQPQKYQEDENFDFSEPQGSANRYKKQGASNIGPYTSENALRLFVRQCIRESISKVVAEKHVGFKRLKGMLTSKTVTSPGISKHGNVATARAGKKKR